MSHALLRAILRRLEEIEGRLRRLGDPRPGSRAPGRSVSHLKPALLQVIDTVAAASHTPYQVAAVDLRHAAHAIGICDGVLQQTLVELEADDLVGLELTPAANLPDLTYGVDFGMRGVLLFVTRPV
jgi:hypothetical protein